MTSSTDPRVVDWPRWNIDADPAALSRYIVPAAVALYGKFRERGGESARVELEQLWATLRKKHIGYAYERLSAPPESDAESGSRRGQLIRVARHDHGTTLSGFLPGVWDHPVASDGTTRRVGPWGLIVSGIQPVHVMRRGGSVDGVSGGFGG